MKKNNRLRNWAVGLCDRMVTWDVDREIRDGARNARKRLKNAPVKILLDNAVIRSVAYLFCNPFYLGEVDFPRGKKSQITARSMVPVYIPPSDERIVKNERRMVKNERMEENLKFLPSILYLAREGYVELFISSALEAEQDTQPVSGYNSSSPWGYHLFFDSDVSIEKLKQDDTYEWEDGIVSSWEHYLKKFQGKKKKGQKESFDSLSPRQQRLQNWIDQEREKDSRFDDFVKNLAGSDVKNKKKLRDYWHVYTADMYGMDYFLTVDFKLSDHIENQSRNKVVSSLTAEIVTPRKLGENWGIKSMSDVTFRFLYKNTVLRDVRHGWHGAVDFGPFGPGKIDQIQLPTVHGHDRYDMSVFSGTPYGRDDIRIEYLEADLEGICIECPSGSGGDWESICLWFGRNENGVEILKHGGQSYDEDFPVRIGAYLEAKTCDNPVNLSPDNSLKDIFERHVDRILSFARW